MRVAYNIKLSADQVYAKRHDKWLPDGLPRRLLGQLLSDPEWKYLDAYANYTKHHSLVRVSGFGQLKGQASYKLYIEDFSHKEESFPGCWATDFVAAAFDGLVPQIPQMLIAMNQERGFTRK